MFFFCKCIFSLTGGCSNFKLCRCIGHIIKRVLCNVFNDLDPKVKGQIMYFLVNASPKRLDIATSNFAGVLGSILCDLDPNMIMYIL